MNKKLLFTIVVALAITPFTGKANPSGFQTAYNKIAATSTELAQSYMSYLSNHPIKTVAASLIGLGTLKCAISIGRNIIATIPNSVKNYKNNLANDPIKTIGYSGIGLASAVAAAKYVGPYMQNTHNMSNQQIILSATLGTFAGVMGFAVADKKLSLFALPVKAADKALDIVVSVLNKFAPY